MANLDDLHDVLSRIERILAEKQGTPNEPQAKRGFTDPINKQVGQALSRMFPKLTSEIRDLSATMKAFSRASSGGGSIASIAKGSAIKSATNSISESIVTGVAAAIGTDFADKVKKQRERDASFIPSLQKRAGQKNVDDGLEPASPDFIDKFAKLFETLNGPVSKSVKAAAGVSEGAGAAAARGAAGGAAEAGVASGLAASLASMVNPVTLILGALLIIGPKIKELQDKLIAFVIKIAKLPFTLQKFGESVLNASRDLAEGSGAIANILTAFKAQDLARKARVGNATADTTGGLANALDGLKTALEPMVTFMKNVGNLFATAIVSLGKIIAIFTGPIFDALNKLIDLLTKILIWLQILEPAAKATAWTSFFDDVADGKLKSPRPPGSRGAGGKGKGKGKK